MQFTLGEAARQCGVAKGTISKAIKTGELSVSTNAVIWIIATALIVGMFIGLAIAALPAAG